MLISDLVVDQVVLVEQDRTVPMIHLAITSSLAAGGPRLSVYEYNGSSYVEDPEARIFIRKTGDPAPTGLSPNDIVLEQTP